MSTESFFEPANVFRLMRSTLVLNRSSIGVFAAVSASIIILASLLDALQGPGQQFHRILFLSAFFPGAIFVAGRLYKGLHDPLKGYTWLLLPASALEKTLSRILFATVVYTGCALLFYFLVSLLAEGVILLASLPAHPLFNPADPIILKSIPVCFSIQAPFLAGGVYFRRLPVSKTFLFLFLLFLVLAGGGFGAARLVFGGEVPCWALTALLTSSDVSAMTKLGSGVLLSVKIWFWVFLPLLSWTLCYVRLRETEL